MRRKLNLTRADRVGYLVGGIALLAWAVRRPTWIRGGAAGVGGWLLWQAYTGSNPLFRPLGIRVNPRPAEVDAHETIVVEDAVTISRPRAEVFAFWRRPGNLPRLLEAEAELVRERPAVEL